MRILLLTLAKAFRELWLGLRQWCGDSAYETYLASSNRRRDPNPLSPAEFYVQQLNRKYSRPSRCC